jgi:carboxymethylenebutenolidase
MISSLSGTAHCRSKFDTRDGDATMATMVTTPYVNHIPTMTGGVGHNELKRFYKYHLHRLQFT